MQLKLSKVLLIVGLLSLALYGIYRTDIVQRNVEWKDMRNRVVGARLMKDGIAPYYHHWHPGDSLKYVMDLDIDTSHYRRTSACTASPFFHRAFIPIAGFDESTIERGFFIFFYMLFAAMVCAMLYKSKQIIITLLFAVAFIFSDGWVMHIVVGQYYFIFGCLFFAIACLLMKNKHFLAGLLLAFLVLLRPNAVLFGVPFLFVILPYKRCFAGFALGILAYGLFAMSSPFEQKNWKEYSSSIKYYSQLHLDFLDKKTVKLEDASYNIDSLVPPVFEGSNLKALAIQHTSTPETQYFREQYNFYLAYKVIFKKAPSMLILNALLAGGILFIMTVLFLKKRRDWNSFPLPSLLFSGLLMYELSCFFAGVTSFPYQMTQWFAGIALMVIFYKKIPKVLFVLAFGAMVGNIVFMPVILGRHLFTESLYLLTLFLIIMGHWKETRTDEGH